MEINRQSLQSHVSHAAQSLRQAASRAAGPMEEKRIAERGYAVEAFEDKLERTSGQNSLEISQTSEARATSRLKTGMIAGLALGSAATLGVLVLGGPLSLGLLCAGGLASAGGLGGILGAASEKLFQKELGNFSQEIARGEAPGPTSGLVIPKIDSPILTNDQWLMVSLPPPFRIGIKPG